MELLEKVDKTNFIYGHIGLFCKQTFIHQHLKFVNFTNMAPACFFFFSEIIIFCFRRVPKAIIMLLITVVQTNR